MTKEEILFKHGVAEVCINSKTLFPAMDEYAKQEAVEFAEWCDDNGWMDCREGEFRRLIITEGGEKDEYKTTSELYELFKQSK